MTIEEYMKDKNKDAKKTEKSYKKSLINRTLLTITIVLILLVTCNVSKVAKEYLNKYIFETNYNFAKINSLYKKYLLDLKPKEEKTKTVSKSNELNYYEARDYLDGVELTISDNVNIKMLDSGLIVFIGEKEGYGSSIVVQQSNGIDVTYGNVTAGDIKVYDYVEKGKIIGTASKKMYMSFASDGRVVDYKTYIK